MVVMAEDVNPVNCPHTHICREKSIPFMYVPDQGYLAQEAGACQRELRPRPSQL